MFQENISNIEPDNSFEFQKEIENFCNASGNLSLDNSIHSDKKQVCSPNKNMVMIDQEQLMELIQAKQTLDAQKSAQKPSRPINVESIMSSAFGSALFSTPQIKNYSSNTSSPSTKESSQGSQDQIECVNRFSEIAPQELSSAKFSQGNFLSNRFAMNLNLTNTVKIDSKFNKHFIEEDSKADLSVLGTSAQGRAIGNDLLNIIDCDESDDSIKQSPQAAMVQNFNLSNEHSNQSSNLTGETSASSEQPEFNSIFTQQAMYMPPAPQNIKAAINAPAFVPSGNYFKPISQVKEFVPTQQVKQKSRGKQFAFPEGGWECGKCQNYNFKGREQCHRCKKEKDDEDFEGKPKHMRLAKKTNGTQVTDQDASVSVVKEIKEVNTSNDETSDDSNRFANKWANSPDYKSPKDKRIEQESGQDGWTCQRCNNHNFGFRGACNICYMGQPYQQNYGQPLPVQQQWCQQQAPMQPMMGGDQIQVQNFMQKQVLNFSQQQFPSL